MSKKNLDQCKTAREFISYADQHGGYVDRQTGSHAIVKGPTGGICPVPKHNGDIPTGTRFSIIKTFRAIGLVMKLVVIGGGIFYALTQLM